MDLSIAKRTIIQLLKEFSIPLLIATIWTAALSRSDDSNIQNLISNFGASFFFSSWMTGQFFRVRKQAGVESSLSNVELRIKELINNLDTKTSELINHISGGDSYLYFFPMRLANNTIKWWVSHVGDYSLYHVRVSIIDVDQLQGKYVPYDKRGHEDKIILNDVSRGQGQLLGETQLGDRKQVRINIFTSARNGNTVQEIRGEEVDDDLLFACRVVGAEGVIREEVPKNFPLNPEGKVDWEAALPWNPKKP